MPSIARTTLDNGRLAAAVAAAALLLAACSSSGSPTASSTPTPSASASSAAPSAAPSSAAATGTAVTTHSGPLGTYLADAQGRTLYLFTTDSMGSSACSGSCATAWPPLVTTGSPTTTGGANASLVGTITRGDGSVQVTYKGHPLYRFASDARAGDLKGQGVGQKWYLVSPAGDMIRANAPATKTTGGAGTGWS